MNNFRVFLSILLFIISAYFIVDIIIYSFSWSLLLFSFIGFVIAHYVWPQKFDNDSVWYELIEIAIYFPFRAIALFFRGVGKIFKNLDLIFDL